MGLEFLDAWILGAQRLGDDFKHFQLRVVDSSGSEVGGSRPPFRGKPEPCWSIFVMENLSSR